MDIESSFLFKLFSDMVKDFEIDISASKISVWHLNNDIHLGFSESD